VESCKISQVVCDSATMSAMTGGHRTPLQPVKESVLSDSSPAHRQNKVVAEYDFAHFKLESVL